MYDFCFSYHTYDIPAIIRMIHQVSYVVVITLARVIKSLVTGQGSHSGVEEYPREKHKPKAYPSHVS